MRGWVASRRRTCRLGRAPDCGHDAAARQRHHGRGPRRGPDRGAATPRRGHGGDPARAGPGRRGDPGAPRPPGHRLMRTRLGRAEPDRVLVRGIDLTGELLGSTSFTEMVGLILLARRPSPDETRMLDALLVVLVEHGLVKPVVAARFVYSNAPESLQAAVAASLLGAGSKHLGSSEWCARVLQDAVGADPNGDVATMAEGIVDDHGGRGERIPGIGQRTHPGSDPRAVRL